MNAPQIILMCLMAMSLGMAIHNHGEPETGTKSFWVTAFSIAFNVWILWWGGFWG